MRRSPIPKRASGARFFDCLLIGLIGYIHQNGVANLFLPSVSKCCHCCWMQCTGTSLDPVSNFTVEKGGKEEMGKMFIKRVFWVGLTGLLGRVNFTQTCTGSVLLPPSPSVPFWMPPRCPLDKKSWRRPWKFA